MSLDSRTAAIETAFNSVGLPTFSVINQAGLMELSGVADAAAVERYGLLQASGAVVAAFPYDPRRQEACSETDPGAGGSPPFARIGAFASWNRYAALSRLLLGAGRLLSEASGLPAKGFRAIVNSRLPEKRLAVTAGLGFIGRSSLVVTNAYGPACLLGALLLPPEFSLEAFVSSQKRAEAEAALIPGSGCGSCRACVDACPGGAVRANGTEIQLERCIQYWTTRPGRVPEPVQAVWGCRLYGCDVCVDACPRSRAAWLVDSLGTSPADRADRRILPAERRPGRLVSLAFLKTARDDEIKAFFRKTALGQSWIGVSELRRNACLTSAFQSVGI
ncbi:MAG: hypothetical protein A2Y38_21330 [Spirochaetes bacterium GWB1_59_5]|nr:MAG: hypothetical protein A2Y38_21330 [Spirochaetes bacterium GWB1_59_5]